MTGKETDDAPEERGTTVETTPIQEIAALGEIRTTLAGGRRGDVATAIITLLGVEVEIHVRVLPGDRALVQARTPHRYVDGWEMSSIPPARDAVANIVAEVAGQIAERRAGSH